MRAIHGVEEIPWTSTDERAADAAWTELDAKWRAEAPTPKDERPLEQHTFNELRALARAQGIKPGRTKAVTIARLREANNQ